MPPRKTLPAPTEAELAILQVLWRRGPSTVREVWTDLGQKSGYTTTLKFLQIMLEKGLVRRDARSVTHVYAAVAAEADTKRRLVRTLIDQVFAGSAADLVLRALSDHELPAAERRAIRELLDEAEGGSPADPAAGNNSSSSAP